jgi:phosphoesterase RecJ-like protein
MKNIENQILKLIQQAQSILVMPSSPPDGDSLGSAVALYLALRKLGKTSTVVCADPIPEVYQFLPMISTITNEFTPTPDFIITVDTAQAELGSIQSELKENKINIILTAKKGRFSADQVSFSHGENRYDLIITVDTAAPHQLGRFYEDNIRLFQEIPVVNIDHHPSNEQFGLINYVDVMSSSTTQLVQGLMEALEESEGKEIIDEDIATLLLAGIITDTGSFQNSNTNPKSFSNSARLIRRGARQQEIIQHVYKTKQLSTLRLWGRVLTNIRIEKDHRFLWSVITKKDLLDTGSKMDETGDIIDELMTNAPDIDIVLLLKEKEDGSLSGSIRTTSDSVDASDLASHWGGGGHARAAGFRLADGRFSVEGNQIIEKIKSYQSRRLHLQTEHSTPAEHTPPESGPARLEEPAKKAAESRPEHKPEDQGTISKKEQTPRNLTPGVKYKFED